MPKIEKKKKVRIPSAEDKTRELGERLVDLESELRSYSTDPNSGVKLAFIHEPTNAVVDQKKVLQFSFHKKAYATGHSDQTYVDANHARGVRHIRFYADRKVV